LAHPENNGDNFIGGCLVDKFGNHERPIAVHGGINVDKLSVVAARGLRLSSLSRR